MDRFTYERAHQAYDSYVAAVRERGGDFCRKFDEHQDCWAAVADICAELDTEPARLIKAQFQMMGNTYRSLKLNPGDMCSPRERVIDVYYQFNPHQTEVDYRAMYEELRKRLFMETRKGGCGIEPVLRNCNQPFPAWFRLGLLPNDDFLMDKYAEAAFYEFATKGGLRKFMEEQTNEFSEFIRLAEQYRDSIQ